ncbi:MAG: hypothetical protein AMXMBFR7_52600 [Planctomycetota bacterium]
MQESNALATTLYCEIKEPKRISRISTYEIQHAFKRLRFPAVSCEFF